MSPKVTDEYKEEKRSQILEGALHCFALKGYQATTINDIAQYLNLSKGAIYTYFSSKEEIYIQLMEEQTRHSNNEIRGQFQTLPTAEEKLHFLFRYFRQRSFNCMRQLGKVYYEFWLYSSRKDELQRLMDHRYQHAISQIGEVIAEGQRNGEFRRDVNDQFVGSLFWILRDGSLLHFSVIGDEQMYQNVWREAEEMLFSYLLTTPDA
ncbi:TetR/AcrR family transcriptional regulator [Paenactinomyces guangxiensis]|uniref:TetR/AcrR family transcriptional regulator n=1 Tax=Paenactinomyces guangxiensis TaxID=1490290 RepID=A0A7W1WQH4_9BACL|nr:TetR/AcrR family transcriptional regulator [Paenactinomyces guangxiensis]MBA4494198.1 TetR/AcrR family transcriptional regulator [Paenactinomyces guangxiensis]MBH8590694.1 TetR/AcrR family transcriptional regulator [Paenactinomyces guangxiensis]